MNMRQALGMSEVERLYNWKIESLLDRIMQRMLQLEKQGLTETLQYIVLEDAFDRYMEKL